MNPALLESLMNIGTGALNGLVSGPLSVLNGFILGGSKGAASMRNAITQQGLTGAQREQNAFNAEQAQISRDFSEMQRQTQYQTAVNDMTAAGLNPAMMYQGAGQAASPTPSAQASGTAPQGHSISDMLSMLTTLSQLDLTEAQANLFKNEASGLAIDNEYKQEKNELTNINLSAATADLLASIIERSAHTTNMVIHSILESAQTTTEAFKQTLILLQQSGQSLQNQIEEITCALTESVMLQRRATENAVEYANRASGDERKAAEDKAYAEARKLDAETSAITMENEVIEEAAKAEKNYIREHPVSYAVSKALGKANIIIAAGTVISQALESARESARKVRSGLTGPKSNKNSATIHRSPKKGRAVVPYSNNKHRTIQTNGRE